ncbi:MAG: ATPase [Lachnospiraceae bacterium]|nr:ATPase [Lachnospiraceae bacterium]
MDIRRLIDEGRGIVGIEFGSTRIKAVLIDENHVPAASGDYTWENRFENGVWTYPEHQFYEGLQECFSALQEDVESQYGTKIKKLKALGFSAMMHGYLAFNDRDELLVPFRTWRNTITGEAAAELSELFHFNIPQRWTIAHVRQAVLNREPHLKDLCRVNTLAGWMHYRMTGNWVVGIGEASGIMPVDSRTMDYDQHMIDIFDRLNAEAGYGFKAREIFPKAVTAGADAGLLTEEGARLLDPTGTLEAGCVVAPPEGDAGTGMAATNAVRMRTGNVSAGTSVFSMVVLEKALSDYYEAIDMVTTPDGSPVAMVHCNNCTSDLNAWVRIMKEGMERLGFKPDTNELYTALFKAALEGSPDCGQVLSYNYVSGEAITHVGTGSPMLVRSQEADFTLPNFMRSLLYSALATLKLGNNILLKEEKVRVDTLYGHGGFFKTKGVGQQLLADALNVPVSVMATAGEGGPWGMALLASYCVNREDKESLPDFLQNKVFHGETGERLDPDSEGVKGFETYAAAYEKGLAMEREACTCWNS